MPYLVDSDWVIPYLHGDSDAVRLLEQLAPQGIGISIIGYMEAYDGLAREPRFLGDVGDRRAAETETLRAGEYRVEDARARWVFRGRVFDLVKRRVLHGDVTLERKVSHCQ